jgi:hypothetical protein
MVLNSMLLVHAVGWWPEGKTAAHLYIVCMSLRVIVLWRLLHTVQGHHSDVAERLGLVFPSLLRAMFVLLSVVYAWAVVAYGLLWDTPVG